MQRIWLILIILAVFIYFVSPWDVIPDIFGLVGKLDDIALLGWLAWFIRRQRGRAQQRRNYGQSQRGSPHGGGPDDRYAGAADSGGDDPYTVLNIDRNATTNDIKRAYKEMTKKYHPDKVAHLGEEFQKIAHERMVKIQEAYATLTKMRG